MRRLLLICLMLFLPLQWSWAAAAGIFQHGSASTTSQFGQHDHEHHAHEHPAVAEGDGGQDALGAVHVDCSVCHFAVTAMVGCKDCVLPDVERAAVLRAAPLPHDTSHIPDLPERPDRAPRPDSA